MIEDTFSKKCGQKKTYWHGCHGAPWLRTTHHKMTKDKDYVMTEENT